MAISIPFPNRQLLTEFGFILSVCVIAFVVVLPMLDIFPYGHMLFVAWLFWRVHWVAKQILMRGNWAMPKSAKPLPEKPNPHGIVLGQGFTWTGDHVDAIQRYVHVAKSLPQDAGKRGGSPAIHGCGSGRDRPVILPYERLRSHVAIEGSTQSGKTVLLANMISQAIAIDQGAVVIIDPKGSDQLYQTAKATAERCGRKFALIRPRTPKLSSSFNVLSSCEEAVDMPGRLRPLFPEGREAYFQEEPLAIWQRVAGMHKVLGITWDIRDIHKSVMDLDALRWTLAQYMALKGADFGELNRKDMPSVDVLKRKYVEMGEDDPLIPGVLRPLTRSQENHQDRCGNLDVALSGVVDVEHAYLFGAKDSLTWKEIDQDAMVVIFRTDSLITQQIGRNIASLFFQDFMGYMGLRYLGNGTSRVPIAVFVDEVGEIVYPDFRQAINKVGEAGGRLVLAWQTKSDLDAALGKFQADVIRANCQSRITMRIADDETADRLAKQSPKVRVTRLTGNRSMLMGSNSGKGISVEHEEIPLLEANILQGQQVGQGFFRLDGSLFHFNIPFSENEVTE